MTAVAPLDRLVECLARLPGVGRRSAERMAMRLVRDSGTLLRDLVSALETAESTIEACARCGGVTLKGDNPCRLCTNPARDDATLCVVEDPNDIEKIEESGAFFGRYHALMGKISPMKGTGPRDLRIRTLIERVEEGGVREVVLALNTDVESDATASFLAECLKDKEVTVSRLAFGLPAGSGIMYSDPVTLARALRGRQDA